MWIFRENRKDECTILSVCVCVRACVYCYNMALGYVYRVSQNAEGDLSKCFRENVFGRNTSGKTSLVKKSFGKIILHSERMSCRKSTFLSVSRRYLLPNLKFEIFKSIIYKPPAVWKREFKTVFLILF